MPTVFVVDADPGRPDSLTSRLRREGYQVLCMRDPEEAAESRHSIHVDLLIVDVRSKALSRRAVVASLRVRKAYQTLPVIVVGNGFLEARRIEESGGAGGMTLADPTADDVVERVRGFLAPLSEPFN